MRRGVAQRPRVRVERLDDHAAAAGPAAAAARELGHERERALLGAEVGEAERGVGVDDHSQRDIGEVVPLRHHLGPHQHAGPRGVEAPEQVEHRAPARYGVGVQAEHRQRGDHALELALEPLGAGAVAGDRHRAAVGARARHGLAVTAVVAGDAPGGPVEHQRHVALRAFPDPAARPAREEVGPAAPVEQDDRLLLARADSIQRFPRARVEQPRRAEHAHELDRRERPAVHPVRKRGALEPRPALRSRGGAPHHQRRSGLHGAALRDPAGVVTGIALLLVGGVVLLVDDDEAEIGERGEDRRPRAHADPRLAPPEPQPLVVALARAEPRVEHGNRVAEALLEAGRRLRRERDLGDQHDGRAATPQRRVGRAQVDLGLPAARDAVQQEPRWLARVHPRLDHGERGPLGRGWLDAPRGRPDGGEGGAAALLGLVQGKKPPGLERTQRGVPAARGAVQPGGRLRSLRERLERGALAASEPDSDLAQRGPARVGDRRGEHPTYPHPRQRADPRPRGEDEREPARRRGAVLLRRPEAEPHELRRHAPVQRRQGLHEALRGQLALIGKVDHHPEETALAERDDEHRPNVDLVHIAGEPVVERAPQRPRRGERLDLRDHGPTVRRPPDAASVRLTRGYASARGPEPRRVAHLPGAPLVALDPELLLPGAACGGHAAAGGGRIAVPTPAAPRAPRGPRPPGAGPPCRSSPT